MVQPVTLIVYPPCTTCQKARADLRETIAKIKEATKHLKGLKIGIMGCIVNGPGEMADADYAIFLGHIVSQIMFHLQRHIKNVLFFARI